jgi:hypothetical protein
MSTDGLPEWWRDFLADIDALATQQLPLHCIGGFAVTLYYGLLRTTGDLDVVDVAPDIGNWLVKVAGRGSALYQRHKLYVQVVTVATLPESYEERLTEMMPGAFRYLRLLVPDPYDLALSKLSRNYDVDLEDVKHLAQACDLNLDLLESRYYEELRPKILGIVTQHDLTLRLWIEAIREERTRTRSGKSLSDRSEA